MTKKRVAERDPLREGMEPKKRPARRRQSRPSRRVGAERIVAGIFGAYSPQPIFDPHARGEGGRFS